MAMIFGLLGRGFGRLGAAGGRAGSPPPASTYTLTAGAGAFVFSGETMTPLVDYKLPADVGSFVEAGVAAGLLAARTMAGAAGSFALTGQVATLTYTPVVSGSVWGDAGTNVTKSTTTIANDTATGAASSFSCVRGTAPHSTGKFYCEVKVLTAPTTPNFYIGVMDNTTATGAAMDDAPSSIPNSCANGMFNGNTNGNWNGDGLGSGFSLSDGDVLGYAYDGDNQFGYLALNNIYFTSGDPTSGATGTGSIMNPSSQTGVRPMISLWGAANGLFQLVTTSAAFTYAPPSGYSEWG